MRTTASYTSWAPAIVGFANWAAWKQLTIISSTQNLFSLAATGLVRAMEATGIKTFPHQLEDGVASDGVASFALESVLASQARVVMVMAYQQDLIGIALAAKSRGMTQAGWAWLGLDSVGEAFNEAQRLQATQQPTFTQALNGWIYFVAYSEAPASFIESVREATRSDFPQFVDGSLDNPSYAANLYDAILLYANTIYNYPEAQDDAGRMIDHMTTSVSFDGKTGRVTLDKRGDMMQSISIMNTWLDEDGTMVQDAFGLFDGATQKMRLMTSRGPTWPGGTRVTPMDSVPTEAAFNTIWILIGCLIGAVLLVVGLVLLLYKYSERFKHFFQTLVFEVGKQVVSICSEVADFATDAVSFHRAVIANSLNGGYQLATGFKIAYSCIFATSAVASSVSTIYRGLQGYKLLQAAITYGENENSSSDTIDTENSPKTAMLAKLRWEAEKSKRDLVGSLVTLFTAAFEDVRPLGLPSACSDVRYR